ncbi:MAG: hypothetical protein J3Q66DRAFT_392775 [Benniella sp.]|nr:MAG: hypothetical protein J3Q66DRAFT_392775 [Benniella sp.]
MMRISAWQFRGPVCRWEETLGPLIEQNRITLRQLDLHLTKGLPTLFLPSLLASLPRLRSLVLFTNTMMVEDVFSILDGCPSSLERFGLNATLTGRSKLVQGESVNNPDYSSIPSNARPLLLKQLRLLRSGHRGTVEDILSRVAVHSLQEFRIEAAYCLQITPTVRDALWRLTSLHVWEKQSGDERVLPGILEAIHPHQLRRAYVYRMNNECIAKLIEKQHQSLESLSVDFEEEHTGALADILATCGRLKSLTFMDWPFVNIQTLIDPQKPWVCTELEVFEGRFGLALPIEPHLTDSLVSDESLDATSIEEQFMRRLGRLTNLRCVVQKRRGWKSIYDPLIGDRMEERMIQWSLASGLEHLHDLVRLRTFKILDQDPRKWIGVPEMMFIKQHWQGLREMVCKDVGDMDVQEWMVTDIPELRHHIAQYLDFNTLKAFSVVCKAWYLDAQPILWSHFKCRVPQEPSVSLEEYALWLDTIRKNAIFFRHILYLGHREPIAPEICDVLLGRCHSLVSIMMRISAWQFQGPVCRWEETLRPLIEQNRITLRHLDLNLTKGLPTLFLPSLLASLPRLRSLVLFTNTIMVEDVFSILDGCPSSLERFGLNATLTGRSKLVQGESVNHPDYSSIPSNAKPLRLKYLRMPYSRIEGSIEGILSRVAVHSLQEFRIETAYCLWISPTVRDALWRLTSLHVEESQLGYERALPGILEAIHPHQLCRVKLYRMTTGCIAKLIEKQHQSLEYLTVEFERNHTGALADILATCSRLKSLTFMGFPSVNIQTLIDPQKPWVCTELEVFEGYFGLSIPMEPRVPDPLVSNKSLDASSSIEEQFMRRLGRLTHLRCVVQKDHVWTSWSRTSTWSREPTDIQDPRSRSSRMDQRPGDDVYRAALA